MPPNWEWTVAGLIPSVILYWPQTNYVYVGGKRREALPARLQPTPTRCPPELREARSSLGDGVGQIGAPTLDIGVNPKLLVVGSESGVLYGVEVPFP